MMLPTDPTSDRGHTPRLSLFGAPPETCDIAAADVDAKEVSNGNVVDHLRARALARVADQTTLAGHFDQDVDPARNQSDKIRDDATATRRTI